MWSVIGTATLPVLFGSTQRKRQQLFNPDGSIEPSTDSRSLHARGSRRHYARLLQAAGAARARAAGTEVSRLGMTCQQPDMLPMLTIIAPRTPTASRITTRQFIGGSSGASVIFCSQSTIG